MNSSYLVSKVHLLFVSSEILPKGMATGCQRLTAAQMSAMSRDSPFQPAMGRTVPPYWLGVHHTSIAPENQRGSETGSDPGTSQPWTGHPESPHTAPTEAINPKRGHTPSFSPDRPMAQVRAEPRARRNCLGTSRWHQRQTLSLSSMQA